MSSWTLFICVVWLLALVASKPPAGFAMVRFWVCFMIDDLLESYKSSLQLAQAWCLWIDAMPHRVLWNMEA